MGRLRTDLVRLRRDLRATGWLALLGLGWGTVIGLLALAVLVSAKDPVCPRVLLALYLPHALVAVGLGAALTLGETRAGTWSLLLTRPVSRARVVLGKLAFGLALLWLATGLPLLAVGWMGSVPGVTAWPWDPTQLDAVWQDWWLLSLWYLVAFYCGLPHRVGRVGRWLPLGAVPLAAQWLTDMPLPGTAALTGLLMLVLVGTVAASLRGVDWS